jgi:NADPH-dependent F420 reductase
VQLAIIGAGDMARGIATRALSGRHPVRIIGRDPEKASKLAGELCGQAPGADAQAAGESAVSGADIVVLALPYPATGEVAARLAAELSGKVLVDIANPADFSTFDLLTEPGTSAAEQLAREAPTARVVKAFNTTFAGNLVAGQAFGAPLDVFIASDDAEAKKAVSDLAASGGLRPIDVGPLKRARALESFQVMHISLQRRMANPWASSIKILS